ISATALDPFLVYADGGYERPSEIYARNAEGKFVPIAEFYRFSRRVVDLGEIGGLKSKVAQAFVAMEDSGFEKHQGVDPRGILRAAVVNVLAGKIKEGASTITQQVARLRFLSSERSF